VIGTPSGLLRGGGGAEFVTRSVNIIERVRTITVVYLSVIYIYYNTASFVFTLQFVRPFMRLVMNRKSDCTHNGSSIWSDSETCGYRCDNRGDRNPLIEKADYFFRITFAEFNFVMPFVL